MKVLKNLPSILKFLFFDQNFLANVIVSMVLFSAFMFFFLTFSVQNLVIGFLTISLIHYTKKVVNNYDFIKKGCPRLF